MLMDQISATIEGVETPGVPNPEAAEHWRFYTAIYAFLVHCPGGAYVRRSAHSRA